MDSGLPFLGCPTLAGSTDMVQKEPEQKWSQAEKPEAKGEAREGGKGVSLGYVEILAVAVEQVEGGCTVMTDG